jgi:hypothetical protein
MRAETGQVESIRLDAGGMTAAWIACPNRSIPAPGQFLLAWSPAERDAPAGAALFPAEIADGGFLAAAPVPETWAPGISLNLLGPAGRGFDLKMNRQANVQRLALAALGETAARLMPLALDALRNEAAVALFIDQPVAYLPASIEIYPLSAFSETASWADFLALDIPRQLLPEAGRRLGFDAGWQSYAANRNFAARLPYPAQALIVTTMPCAGIADCGVCAVATRHGWKLACKDGPVFNLNEIIME